jgi:hypothetical protein
MDSYTLKPLYKKCEVHGVNLSVDAKKKVFIFTGADSEKNEATSICFASCGHSVDFIPLKIFSTFPNLNGIEIVFSQIPILKENLFGEKFVKIEFLRLVSNEIQEIEPNALQHLKNLKWIRMSNNPIEVLGNIFRHNTMLEFIGLSNNRLHAIPPKLFDGLNNLKIVLLQFNHCVNGIFTFEDPNGLKNLQKDMEVCYSNCKSTAGCSFV